MEVTYPDVKVRLTGTDGNAFAIIGAVKAAIRQKRGQQAAVDFTIAACKCENYDALLVFVMQSVVVS